MVDIGLERLLEKEEETTAERINKSIQTDKTQFEGVYGIKDVKENLMNALEQASFISRQGYIPIILLMGPSGSGKTELINSITRSYKKYARKNEIFTLKINGNKCVYNENPYNIYRSIIPQELKIDSKILTNRKRPEICYSCEKNLEELVKMNEDTYESNKGVNLEKDITLERIFPQSSVIEFGDNFLSPVFIDVIKNSNRSILTISADKSRLETINPKVFQLLNNVYDNNFSDVSGNRVPLDSVIMIHSNETFMELSSDDEKTEARPLLERIIRVDVRRNLSYSEEEKISQDLNLPFRNMVPHALEYISKFNVLSRISSFKISSAKTDDIDNILDILDHYDSSKLELLQRNMTRSMSTYLSTLVPDFNSYLSSGENDNKFLEDAAKAIIFDNDKAYRSGWTTGISSRALSSMLNFNYTSNTPKYNFSFSDITNYILKNEDELDNGSRETIRNYIDALITRDVNFDVEYALLSFYFGEHFKDYTEAISNYINSLINKSNNQDFKDLSGYLSEAARYFDVEKIKNEITAFSIKKVPLRIVNFRSTFDDILSFLVGAGDDFVKKESKYDSFIGESGKEVNKNSDLYLYLSDFLKNKFGYFDEAVDEAFKIYKRGTIFYDK